MIKIFTACFCSDRFRSIWTALRLKMQLDASKDVDCMTEASLCSVFTGRNVGYPPCTPEACLAILEHYNIPCEGKNVVVIGRRLLSESRFQ